MGLTFNVRLSAVNTHKYRIKLARKFITILVEPARVGMDDILDIAARHSHTVWISDVELDLVECRNR